MSAYLELRVDKFIFKVAADCFYSSEGVWVKPEEDLVRIGLSDFLQQRNGDVAFAEVKSAGTQVQAGDEVAEIETIKVNLSLVSPVAGVVVEVNPAMEGAPEAINQDPYGAGWLAVLKVEDWEAERGRLLDPQSYFEQMKVEAEEETRQP
jgi:glycine cleavage system H protein